MTDSEITGKRKPGGALRISIVPAVDGASRAASAPRYGWVLQLRNTAFDVRGEDMTYRAFRALATMRDGSSSAAGSTTPASRPTLPTTSPTAASACGASWRSSTTVTRRPSTRSAPPTGYAVVVQAMDGFSATYTSAELMKIGSKIIVADRANDAPLIVPAAELKEQPPRHVLRLLEAVLAAQGRE